MFLEVSQQRTRTVKKSVCPEYGNMLHFPNIGKEELGRLHMKVAVLGKMLDHFVFVPVCIVECFSIMGESIADLPIRPEKAICESVF